MLRVDARDKAKLIDPLFTPTGPRFRLAFAGLFGVIAWGVYTYIRQLQLGLGETGMSRPTYWGIYMVNFIFFIGISHAGTLISAILRVTGAEWRRPITRIAEAITAFALIVGSLQIIIDMGRPDRLVYVLLYGRLQSPILWDVVSVTAYFLGSLTYLYLPLIPDVAILRDNCPPTAPAWRLWLYRLLSAGWRGSTEQWKRLEHAISLMAIFIIPIAISVHTIISWILATTVQPGWHSSIFGPYFVVGAIFSGIGALFLAMSAVRSLLGLEQYISGRQYRNLGLLFLTMNLIWFYFTYAENLSIAAGQQTEEFPILASKLWGEYSTSFWTMVALMAAALWLLVAPRLMPAFAVKFPAFQPRFTLAWVGAAGAVLLLVFSTKTIQPQAALDAHTIQSLLWGIILVFGASAFLGLTSWLKSRPVAAAILASICVLPGMWLERWNIIVPTMTHPRLIQYAAYRPTLTEFSLTAASVALFTLLFLVFFKLFPAVSLWEFAEGRVIEEAASKVTLPLPEPSESNHMRSWGVKR